jgi:hypothetical protein
LQFAIKWLIISLHTETDICLSCFGRTRDGQVPVSDLSVFCTLWVGIRFFYFHPRVIMSPRASLQRECSALGKIPGEDETDEKAENGRSP